MKAKFFDWTSTSCYAEYGGISEEDEQKIAWYDSLLGVPLVSVEDWEPPRLEQYLGENGKKRKPAVIADDVSAAPLHLVSEKAAHTLSEIFARHAKLYPVILEDALDRNFYMVVPTTEIDCVDREQSKGPLAKYGPNPHLFASIDEWVFREEEIGDADLFVLPDSPTTTYVSERFKQRVIEAGLKGFCLKRHFWEEDPFIS